MLIFGKYLNYLPLLAAVVIPLEQKGWTEISFGKIPANTVNFSSKAINIKVKNSASPLIYKFDQSLKIKSLSAALSFKGNLSTNPSETGIEEDSLFRMGLVAEGDKTLSTIEKLFAPDWVKQLFTLVPSSLGLDKIYFFNIGRSFSQMGKSRVHPKRELMNEEIVAVRLSNEINVTMAKELNTPLKSAALWVSVDGDDTKSTFETTIEKIILNTQD